MKAAEEEEEEKREEGEEEKREEGEEETEDEDAVTMAEDEEGRGEVIRRQNRRKLSPTCFLSKYLRDSASICMELNVWTEMGMRYRQSVSRANCSKRGLIALLSVTATSDSSSLRISNCFQQNRYEHYWDCRFPPMT